MLRWTFFATSLELCGHTPSQRVSLHWSAWIRACVCMCMCEILIFWHGVL